jgi:hypothetical protein
MGYLSSHQVLPTSSIWPADQSPTRANPRVWSRLQRSYMHKDISAHICRTDDAERHVGLSRLWESSAEGLGCNWLSVSDAWQQGVTIHDTMSGTVGPGANNKGME